MTFRLLGAAVCATAALALTACAPSTGTPTQDGRLRIVTSFYPLQFVAERVGGSHVQVTSLTRPGTEPHDLELTPRDVARLQDADVVVYLRGFQPAVDQAVDEHTRGQRVIDVAPAARLRPADQGDVLGSAPPTAGAGHEQQGALDPHFWLDPTRLADVTEQVAAAFGDADPSARADFARAATSLVGDLRTLDEEFARGLSHCASRDVVTSHSAFGYLAQRYGLHQVGITGLTPEAEPDPRSLAQVTTFVRQHHVSTIYSETLVSPAIARTVARETGATTAVLDPIESIDTSSAGRDYLQVMRSDLDTLRRGQSCS